MASLNTLTRTHFYGPLSRLGIWFVRTKMDGPILRRTAVTDDFGRLVYVNEPQLAVSVQDGAA